MAENVKRRIAAARLAVAFVAAGTIAGATAWAQAGPPPTAQSSASDIFAKVKLDSSNIKNGSLLYQDFKPQEVLSSDAFFKYKKAETGFKKSVNGELGSVNGDLNTIKGELPSFIKTSDADARYIKMNDAVVRGDGSVHTATGLLPAGANAVPLLDLPGLVKVVGIGGSKLQITNNGSDPLTHTGCPSGAQGGGNVPPGTLSPGATLTCDGSVSQLLPAVQLIGQGANPTVMTLNFSAISVPGGTQNTVQILIGL